MEHTDAVLILLVGMASGVSVTSKYSGNVIAAGIVTTILIAGLLKKNTQGIFQSVLKIFIKILSLGGSVSETAVADINPPQLRVVLALNIVAAGMFVLAENNEEYDQWAHSIWHALAYIVLWLLIRILVKEDAIPCCSGQKDQKNGLARKDREDYETLLPSRRGRTRLGTGRWS